MSSGASRRPAAPDSEQPKRHADGELLGIGAAAACAGVSERALRYYQQLGLITPAGCTQGGLRRYSQADLERVAWIRQLQSLLGLSLDEIGVVLRTDDRLTQLRLAYYRGSISDAGRRELISESQALLQEVRQTLKAKRTAIDTFLADLDGRIQRTDELLAQLEEPAGKPS
ncbi:MAG TPA: MerR family transcriptional regulator [Streptosporangiaceae bacterium]